MSRFKYANFSRIPMHLLQDISAKSTSEFLTYELAIADTGLETAAKP